MANSDTKIYDSALTELDQWYKLAQKNRDNKQFYNYLYAYIGVIAENRQLYSEVKNLELQEILNAPEGDERHELLREQTLTARKQNGLTLAQKTYFQDEMLYRIEKSRLKETQLSYWWYLLYNSFYNVYSRDLRRVDISKVSRIDPKSVEKSLEKLKVKPSEAQILQIKMPDKQEKSKLEQINYSIANFKPPVKQEVYVTSLSMLHIKLVGWLSKNTDNSIESKSTESATEEEINFKDSKDMLPEIVVKIGSDFALHKNNIISHKGVEIPLEFQIARVVAYIIKRSKNDSFTPTSLLAKEILSGSHEYEEPEKYVVKMVSEARRIFKSVTNTDTDYFPNKRGYGYRFKP